MALNPSCLRLYLVTDPSLCRGRGVVETVQEAVRGGVTLVQLRDKFASTRERVAVGLALRDILQGTGVPLVVNDDIEAAVAIGADGVHVGQSDSAPHEARARLGSEAIVGLSCETVAHAMGADPRLLDYVGLGPVFATATKPGHADAMGLRTLAAACAATTLPAVAIGGVQLDNLTPVLACGVRGVAVVSAICGQPDPHAAAQRLWQTIAQTMGLPFPPRPEVRGHV